MKVVKSGNPNGLWKMEMTCTGHGNGNAGCGAILEINGNDPFHTHSTFGGSEDYVTIECPECGTWTDLNDNEQKNVPYGIRIKINDMEITSVGQAITRKSKS